MNCSREEFTEESNYRGMQPMILEEGGIISPEELQQKDIAVRSFSRTNSLFSRKDSPGDRCFVFFWIVTLTLYFLIVPFMCLYVGISYHYCQDLFSTWLIVGGVLCYVDALLFGVFMYSRRGKEKCFSGCCCLWFWFNLVVVGWWLFGFVRILAPAKYAARTLRTGKLEGIYAEDWMKDDDCRFYLFTFPFWLTMSPWILFGLIFVSALCAFGIDNANENYECTCC